jgi:hypothetical protein
MPIENDESFNLVQYDVQEGIGHIFAAEGDHAVAVAKPFAGEERIANAHIVAVPWTYRCRHAGDFQGLFPTGRELTIEGVTMVDSRQGKTVLHRYVDWMGVITQLGLDISWRVPVTEDEDRAGRETAQS